MISRAIAFDSAMSVPTSRPEPAVGPLRRRGAPRVDDEQPGAVAGRPSARGGRRSGASRGRSSPRGGSTSVSSISWYDEVPPPAPNTVARPTTLGACQVRLQQSMLLRAHHRARELLRQEVHLVGRLRAAEQADAGGALGVQHRGESRRRRGRGPRPRWRGGARRPRGPGAVRGGPRAPVDRVGSVRASAPRLGHVLGGIQVDLAVPGEPRELQTGGPAVSTARAEGALTATTAVNPAAQAFATISKEARPLTNRPRSMAGRAPSRSSRPTTLSTAL